MDKIDKLAWLCIKNKQLLAARSKDKNMYYIPGGKREAGESDQQALIREIKEELSVDLIPATIQYAGTFESLAHGQNDGTMVQMICYFADFSGELNAEAEIEEIIWLTQHDKDKCSVAAQLIMDWLKAQNLII